MPGSFRSDNPTHSVVAVGKRARELTLTHGQNGLRKCIYGEGAFAKDSPWEKIYSWNAAYCFLGVDFEVNTIGHFAQCLLVERCLENSPPRRRARMAEEVRAFDRDSIWPRYDFERMGMLLDKSGLVKSTKIGPAKLRCVRAAALVDFIIEEVESMPEKWMDEKFLAWMYRTRRPAQEDVSMG